MKMFCITIFDDHYKKIKNLGYIPVGLGKNISNKNFLTDKSKNNISDKNPFYGEYTFHYNLWKNNIDRTENNWIGFCQYRKFWSLKSINAEETESIEDLSKKILKKIPEELKDFDTILGEPLFVNQFKLSKFFKKNLFKMLKSPSLFFISTKRNLKFHFDMMHGDGNLDKAIKLLDTKDRSDFRDFVNKEVSFNPHNMFICRSSLILNNYYETIFPWLKRCESEFGFDLKGYGYKRIYGFLAERFMSYWFKKYTKYTTLPIIFKDITDFN